MGATLKGEVVEPSDDNGGPWKISLAQCPRCSSALVGAQESDFFDDWERATRVWPSPPLQLNPKIPRSIRESLEEAHKCLGARSYAATVMMSGRALEAIGRHFYPPTKGGRPLMLKQALDKLAKDEIIDGRLYKWGLALHKDRNLAAHPSDTHFKRADARDVFKFSNNICEYIFVLSAEFEAFEKRRAARSSSK